MNHRAGKHTLRQSLPIGEVSSPVAYPNERKNGCHQSEMANTTYTYSHGPPSATVIRYSRTANGKTVINQ